MEVDYFQLYLKTLMEEYQNVKRAAVKEKDIAYCEGMIAAIKHIGMTYMISKEKEKDTFDWKRPTENKGADFLS